MIQSALILVARHGRLGLIAGLAAGLALPGLAAILRPWIPELVALLLFLTAFRIGATDAVESLGALRRSAGLVLALQVVAPLMLVGALKLLGLPLSPLAMAAVLVLAAPSVTGAPNFAILLGHDPAPGLRLLILGTAVLPLTCLPVFVLLPELGGVSEAVRAAARLLMVILAAALGGFALRHWRARHLPDDSRRAVDGLTVIVLAVVVVALMSAVVPAFRDDPLTLGYWLAAAFGINFGAQALSFAILKPTRRPDAVVVSIIAGNRNFALFLVALPAATTEPLLIFLGCYQFPMYLTPTLLRRFYRADRSHD